MEAPAEAVWEVVAHRFDRMGEWATAIEASTALAGAPGTQGAPVAGRVCRTGVRLVPEVAETIVAYDEVGRTLTYEATSGMPGFVRQARNRWQVTALDGGRSRVAFNAQLEVRGLFGWLARRVLLARVGRSGGQVLDDLKHFVERGEPTPRKRPGADPVLAVGVWPTTRLLRAELRANAVFSLVCGVVLMGAGWWLAEPWGLGPVGAPPLAGVGLAGFGLLLAWLAAQPVRVLRRGAVAVIVADGAWVAGSVIVVVLGGLPVPGAVAVGVAAAVVAGVAVGQVAGLL
ncbi:SRPBCC family protein, partial [Actinophytocola sp.]|uniref:SRPBCC family protein n=1 Tax=Actinophytocola sp. TaxID=1872138 RepID=UPI002D808DC6